MVAPIDGEGEQNPDTTTRGSFGQLSDRSADRAVRLVCYPVPSRPSQSVFCQRVCPRVAPELAPKAPKPGLDDRASGQETPSVRRPAFVKLS